MSKTCRLNGKQCRPWSDCSFRSILIWIYLHCLPWPVCLKTWEHTCNGSAYYKITFTDIDGNGLLDQNEVEALFQKEVGHLLQFDPYYHQKCLPWKSETFRYPNYCCNYPKSWPFGNASNKCRRNGRQYRPCRIWVYTVCPELSVRKLTILRYVMRTTKM